ncbi:MAG: hypothetical protein ACR2NO_01390 [Chloroflexota bacterium]
MNREQQSKWQGDYDIEDMKGWLAGKRYATYGREATLRQGEQCGAGPQGGLDAKAWGLVRSGLSYADARKAMKRDMTRAEFARMADDARRGRFDVVVVPSVSRWAVDAMPELRELNERGVVQKQQKKGVVA